MLFRSLTVGFAADKVDADGQVFALLCKSDLADAATFMVNATLRNGVSDTFGTLSAVLDQPPPRLFVIGIGPAED